MSPPIPERKHESLADFISLVKFPPHISRSVGPDRHVTLSDLHSNSVKAVYQMIETALASLSEEKYLTLVELFNQYDDAPDATLALYREIINQIKFHPENGFLRFVGDDIGDRSRLPDICMFLLFQRMVEQGMNFHILCSNHGIEGVFTLDDFLENSCEDSDKWKEGYILSGENKISAVKLVEYLKNHPSVKKEVETLFENIYLPHLRLIDIEFQINEETDEHVITFFTHAISGFNSYQKAKEYLVDILKKHLPHVYKKIETELNIASLNIKDYPTRRELMAAIIREVDQINRLFSSVIQNKKTRDILKNQFVSVIEQDGSDTFPVLAIINNMANFNEKNRVDHWLDSESLARQAELKVQIRFCHGHCDNGCDIDNDHVNILPPLDDRVGKGNVSGADEARAILCAFDCMNSDIYTNTYINNACMEKWPEEHPTQFWRPGRGHCR